MIRLVVFDIDGVLTDGAVSIDENGLERKNIGLRTLDALTELKSEYLIAAITGENTKITEYFRTRLCWDAFISGEKNKKRALEELSSHLGLSPDEICYVGDGKYDVDAITFAGLGVCPADGCAKAKLAADIILKSGGGKCVEELQERLEEYRTKNLTEPYLLSRLTAHMALFRGMADSPQVMKTIMAVCDDLCAVLKNGGRLFLCGNGGSAADAQHIAAEFVGRFYKERRGLNAEALTANSSILTCIGNDYGFEQIFARQLEAKAFAGDMLIALSTSGRSGNVLQALRYAKSHGISAVLMTGSFENAGFCEVADHVIAVPSTDTPRIQEAHIFIGHVLAEYVEEKLL